MCFFGAMIWWPAVCSNSIWSKVKIDHIYVSVINFNISKFITDTWICTELPINISVPEGLVNCPTRWSGVSVLIIYISHLSRSQRNIVQQCTTVGQPGHSEWLSVELWNQTLTSNQWEVVMSATKIRPDGVHFIQINKEKHFATIESLVPIYRLILELMW